MVKDGPKDHPRIFFLSAAWISSRMLQDGLRMVKDGPNINWRAVKCGVIM